MLGLPDPVAACLFDLDGVLTETARLHAAAWKEMFDGYLRSRSERTGEPFVPFRLPADYDDYVDGRPRADGTRTFLRSRGIVLPDGGGTDTAADETVRGLGNTKNAIVLRKMAEDGVDVYPGSGRYVRAAPTPIWRPLAAWAPSQLRPRSSRTHWRGWPRDGRAGSAGWSGWTGWVSGMRCGGKERMW